jgi:nucleoside 2-deoxyribosyltransferase
MKIYFAGAIRGGREDARMYKNIIRYLAKIGQVLTEHVGNIDINFKGEISNKDKNIFIRDINWLQMADVVVAEVTTPSLGVGYELGIAEKLKKPVLCLHKSSENYQLSAMLNGNNKFCCQEYDNLANAKLHIDVFFQDLI